MVGNGRVVGLLMKLGVLLVPSSMDESMVCYVAKTSSWQSTSQRIEVGKSVMVKCEATRG
jgi:hypothetical protein